MTNEHENTTPTISENSSAEPKATFFSPSTATTLDRVYRRMKTSEFLLLMTLINFVLLIVILCNLGGRHRVYRTDDRQQNIKYQYQPRDRMIDDTRETQYESMMESRRNRGN